jgi:hypothetical protein
MFFDHWIFDAGWDCETLICVAPADSNGTVEMAVADQPWVELTRQQARELAGLLLRAANA